MMFEADESSYCQTDMVALRYFQAILAAFDTSELFQASMVDFDLPGVEFAKGGILQGQVQLGGCPVFSVTVCADGPEDLDPAITLEMDLAALRRDKDLADGSSSAAIDTDLAIALQLGQPMPTQRAQQLQVVEAAIPTVEEHQRGRKATSVRLKDHRLKMIVLAQLVLLLVVEPKVARQTTGAIGPD